MVSAHRDGRSVIGLARVQSGVNLAAAVVWIVVAWLIPARLGVRLFGASWAGLHDIVVVVGVSFLGLAISSGPLTAIRSRGQLNAGLATQFMVAVLVLLSTALGGLLIDQGTLRGFAAGNVLASGIAWLVLTRWRVRDLVGERSAPRQ